MMVKTVFFFLCVVATFIPSHQLNNLTLNYHWRGVGRFRVDKCLHRTLLEWFGRSTFNLDPQTLEVRNKPCIRIHPDGT